jgi:hypothetical protein
MRWKVILILICIVFFDGCRKSDFIAEGNQEVYRDNGNGIGTVTWTKDKEYLIEGFVYINDGQVLTIEPGTVVRFRPGQAENASALIVSHGGKIIANGTNTEPIIFTSEADDLVGSVGKDESGLWGGLIILGNAPINIESGEMSIEGIPFAEPRGFFGGVDENDDSGILRYVSIRHCGTNIGDGNEINGLTLGGVGRNTEIEYVEIISTEDDGIEIFGGTVNLKHLVVSNCGDDAFDYDLGWSGNGQFWLGVQSGHKGNNLIEANGGTDPVDGLPNSLPYIFNATLIGNGYPNSGDCAIFEKNAGGVIANSILMNKPEGVAVEVTDHQHDSFYQWEKGNLTVANNVFFDVPSASSKHLFALKGNYNSTMQQLFIDYFSAARNEIMDPKIDYKNGSFIPKNKIKGDLLETPSYWFQIVDFKGAFGEDNWLDGWTLISKE